MIDDDRAIDSSTNPLCLYGDGWQAMLSGVLAVIVVIVAIVVVVVIVVIVVIVIGVVAIIV